MGEREYVLLLRAANTATKMTTFDKDFIRREQVRLTKQFEKGEIQPVSFNEMFRKT